MGPRNGGGSLRAGNVYLAIGHLWDVPVCLGGILHIGMRRMQGDDQTPSIENNLPLVPGLPGVCLHRLCKRNRREMPVVQRAGARMEPPLGALREPACPVDLYNNEAPSNRPAVRCSTRCPGACDESRGLYLIFRLVRGGHHSYDSKTLPAQRIPLDTRCFASWGCGYGSTKGGEGPEMIGDPLRHAPCAFSSIPH